MRKQARDTGNQKGVQHIKSLQHEQPDPSTGLSIRALSQGISARKLSVQAPTGCGAANSSKGKLDL